jgi:hypothetical protein
VSKRNRVKTYTLTEEKTVTEYVECGIDHRPGHVGGDQVEEPGSGGVVTTRKVPSGMDSRNGVETAIPIRP